MTTPCILVDVDTTLCNVDNWLHLLLPDHPQFPGKKDYQAFHEGSAGGELVKSTYDSIKQFEFKYWHEHGQYPRRIITTAREAVWRQLTEDWLDWNSFDFDFMLMRPIGDRRPDFEVKFDMVCFLEQQGYEPVHAWDDSPAVLSMYETERIPFTEVPRAYRYESVTGETVIA